MAWCPVPAAAKLMSSGRLEGRVLRWSIRAVLGASSRGERRLESGREALQGGMARLETEGSGSHDAATGVTLPSLRHPWRDTDMAKAEARSEGSLDDGPLPAKVAQLEQELLVLAERLRASEKRFDGTFEQAAVGVAHVRPEGRFLRINQRFCKIVGHCRAEMLERRFQDVTHADDAEADRVILRQLLGGEVASLSREKRYRRKDGTAVWVNLTTSLVRDADGKPDYFMSVVEDISERKRAEDALRDREERFRQTFDQAPIGQAIVALDGRFERVNDALCRITGYGAEELAQLTFSDITHPDDRAVSLERTRQLLAGEVDSLQLDKRYVRKDGATVWVRTWPCLIKDAGGPL